MQNICQPVCIKVINENVYFKYVLMSFLRSLVDMVFIYLPAVQINMKQIIFKDATVCFIIQHSLKVSTFT